jgi:hypothetical protein
MVARASSTTLLFIASQAIVALDHGKGPLVSIEDAYMWLESGSLLRELERVAPEDFDLSLWPSGSEEEAAILHALSGPAEGLVGRERRKTGVENSGIALVAVWLITAVSYTIG